MRCKFANDAWSGRALEEEFGLVCSHCGKTLGRHLGSELWCPSASPATGEGVSEEQATCTGEGADRTCKHGTPSSNICLGCRAEIIAEQERRKNERLAEYHAAPSALGVQIGGDHYKKLAIQPMQYSMVNGLDACQHTIIKYITRFRDKGGIADLEKARHTLDMLIEFEKGRGHE